MDRFSVLINRQYYMLVDPGVDRCYFMFYHRGACRVVTTGCFASMRGQVLLGGVSNFSILCTPIGDLVFDNERVQFVDEHGTLETRIVHGGKSVLLFKMLEKINVNKNT